MHNQKESYFFTAVRSSSHCVKKQRGIRCVCSEARDAAHEFCRHGVNATPENSTFDLDQGLAETTLWRDGLQQYDLLDLPACDDVLSGSLLDVSPATATDLSRMSANKEFVGADYVPMQVLNRGEQEKPGKYIPM